MRARYAAAENDDIRARHTRYTAEQDAAPALSLLQAMGSDLGRQPPGNASRASAT